MRVIFRSLTIILIGLTTSVSAAAQDFDAMLRRLAEVEARQAKSQATIEALRSEIELLRRNNKSNRVAEKTKGGRLAEKTRNVRVAKSSRGVVIDVPADAGVKKRVSQPPRGRGAAPCSRNWPTSRSSS